MLYNDLSNRGAETIAFRVENCLLHYKEEGLRNKTLNILKGRNERAEIDEEMLRRLIYVYKKTDYNIALVVAEEYYRGLEEFLIKHGVPFSELIVTRKPVDIAIRLNVRDILYYVDNDVKRMYAIGNVNCILPSAFDLIVRGR